MANTHVMIRTDNMAGTTQGKYLVSLRVAAEIDNGLVVAVGGYEDGAREVRTYTTPAVNTDLGKIAILASEEVDKERAFNAVGEFTNKKGSIARGYFLEHGDIFSVTEGAFDKKPTVGSIVELQAGNKLKVVSAATSGSTTVGTCDAIETDGATTWYVIRVA